MGESEYAECTSCREEMEGIRKGPKRPVRDECETCQGHRKTLTLKPEQKVPDEKAP